MRDCRSAIMLVSLLLIGAMSSVIAQTLSGKDNGKSETFSVDGPWTMDWRAKSEFPLLASIEMRLHDGETGEFLGMVAEIKGTGGGLKVFEDPGTYQVVVVGTFVEWEIDIEEIGEEDADKLKRNTAASPRLIDSVKKVSRLVPESSFSSWRPQGDDNLRLFADDGIGWRVSFSPACPGLEKATALSFVMTADNEGDIGQYNSILLDDGTRCYFDEVIPDVVP